MRSVRSWIGNTGETDHMVGGCFFCLATQALTLQRRRTPHNVYGGSRVRRRG